MFVVVGEIVNHPCLIFHILLQELLLIFAILNLNISTYNHFYCVHSISYHDGVCLE